MSTVTFNTYTTDQLTRLQFQSLVNNFNTVFEKDFPVSNFEQQYNMTVKGFSYHSLMEQDGEIVGACTGIPYEYMYSGQKKIFSLLVGLFIVKEFRKDPFALYKIYSKLKDLMIKDGVSLTMAVPNQNSHPYYIHALKWKQVGTLPYYALPVKYGNISGGNKGLSVLSSGFVQVQSFFNSLFTSFLNSKEKDSDIFLIPKEPLSEKQRYNEAHIKIKTKKFNAFYRVETEEGIKTAYLIDFYNNEHIRDSRTLTEAVHYIVKSADPDLVLFIGELKMFQTVLFRVPKNKEPRPLNFCVEILDKKSIDEKAYNFSSWNFGLYNFDVR